MAGLRMVRVDTGSATNLISDATAERLHMTRQLLVGGSVRGVGGSRPVSLAVSDTVQLGRARMGGMWRFITTANDAFPPGTDGLLGMDFLSQYDDDLDFQAGHLRLVRAHGDCALPHSPLPAPLYGVKFHSLSAFGSPVVDVVIHGQHFAALIDTGATNTLLFRSAASRLGLAVDGILDAHRGRAISGIGGGGVRAAFGKLRVPIEIGALEVSNLPITITDQDSGAGVDMLLGFEFEDLVHLWISHSSHTLLMQYPARATPLAGGAE